VSAVRESPDENADDSCISGDADHAHYANVQPEHVNEPIRSRLDDVTVAQPMSMQIRSAVVIAMKPRERIRRCDWFVVGGDVSDVRER